MFVIDVPYFNLDQIYSSGQCFRWIKLKDMKYVIPDRDTALKVEQVKDRLIMSCTEEEFFEHWYHYFDLGTDYLQVNTSMARINPYAKICAVRGKGIHILKQDLFEMIISFMLATATNIPRIKQMLTMICESCGIKHVQSMREAGRITWYEFPTPKMILGNQDEIGNLGLNRKESIIQICQDIVDGWLDLDELSQMGYEDAKECLMQFEGIGPKVADCICLYGLHLHESFPIDTHISDILKREFDCDYETFHDWYLDGITEHAGIIQQYMFYNEINPPKEVSGEWD